MPIPAGSPLAAGPSTLADLVAETKRHLMSYQREPMNRLAGDVARTAGTLTLEFDSEQIQPGALLQVGLELMYVWQSEPTSKTVTVERGVQGSLPLVHFEGDVVTVNPKFPDFAIVKALNDDLADLSAQGLYAVRSTDLAFSYGASGYDLAGASDLLEVLEVRYRLGQSAAYRQWPVLSNYELSRQVDPADFPSGLALFLHEGAGDGQPIRVLYKATFGTLGDLQDEVEAVAGLPPHLHDLPPMGAAVRLVAPREIRRNFTESQGDSRRAEEVPPGAVASSMREVARMRAGRIAAEAARLARLYPDRGFIPSSASPAYRGYRRSRRW